MNYLLSFLIVLLIVGLESNDYIYTKVSWYGKRFHNKPTASGKLFNMNELTAASKVLPFGTMVEVTNLNNNKSIIVEITDRGPYIEGRDLDLSKAAFDSIANLNKGVIHAKYLIFTKPP